MDRIKKKSVSIIIIAVLVLLMLSGCDNEPKTEDGLSTNDTQPVGTKESFNVEGMLMILNLNPEEGQIVMKHMESGRQYVYTYDISTRIVDKYDGIAAYSSLSQGKIVEIKNVDSDGTLKEIKLSGQTWEYDNIENYSIDIQKGIFTIGVTDYAINEKTVYFAGDTIGTVANLGENDTLTVVGKDREVWGIIVTTGHGYVSLKNTQVFNDSLICIGNITTLIKGDMTVEVPEGDYKVTVANNGYGGSVDITVDRDQTVTLDLEELKGEGPKSCELKFSIALEGAKIYLDGEQVNADETLSVVYGKHSLSVMAEGYETWNKTLYVNSPKAEIALELSSEDTASDSSKNNSAEDTKKDNTNSTNNTNSSTSSTNKDKDSTTSDKTSSDSSEKKQTELDYLTTISDMLSVLMKD